MIQIKLFQLKTSDLQDVENKVNAFLEENKDVKIVDIKYTSEVPNPGNSAWRSWSVMVIYEKI